VAAREHSGKLELMLRQARLLGEPHGGLNRIEEALGYERPVLAWILFPGPNEVAVIDRIGKNPRHRRFSELPPSTTS